MEPDSIGITSAFARIREIQEMTRPPAPAGEAPPVAGSQGFPAQLASASTPVPAGASAVAPTATTAPASALPADDAALAARLDAWMAEKVPGTPLAGHGAVFVREGRANGVDPRALVAIAYHESKLGTLGSGRDIHNAFGWGPAIPFDSWEQNIATVAGGLRESYLDEGRVTIATIQTKWAPLGVANDPTNLNSSWTRAVSATFQELGGDPAASVALAPAPSLSV